MLELKIGKRRGNECSWRQGLSLLGLSESTSKKIKHCPKLKSSPSFSVRLGRKSSAPLQYLMGLYVCVAGAAAAEYMVGGRWQTGHETRDMVSWSLLLQFHFFFALMGLPDSFAHPSFAH